MNFGESDKSSKCIFYFTTSTCSIKISWKHSFPFICNAEGRMKSCCYIFLDKWCKIIKQSYKSIFVFLSRKEKSEVYTMEKKDWLAFAFIGFVQHLPLISHSFLPTLCFYLRMMEKLVPVHQILNTCHNQWRSPFVSRHSHTVHFYQLCGTV